MAPGSQPMLAASVRKLFDQVPASTLALWCENKECAIDFEETLTGGLTKAKLAVVSVQDRNGSRTAVLKHCPADPYRESRDFHAYERASLSGPPGFADVHLVSLDKGINTLIPDGCGGQFVVMKYLGPGPRHYYSTLADLLGKSALGAACESVTKQILIDWNDQPNLPTHERSGISAKEFLSEVLGERCAPGGHLREVIENLTVPGQDLRWPLAAVASGEGVDHIRMKGLKGNAHGDLHPDNVFISTPNSGHTSNLDYKDFALIDLTTFGDNRLLAVDPAHLIIDIIARKLAGITPEARSRLEDFVIDPDSIDPAGISGELAAAIKTVHDVGTTFAVDRGHYKTWVSERLAAIIACALLFVGRAKDDTSRLWFLALATKALKRLSETSPRPDTGAAKRANPPEGQWAAELPARPPHDELPENQDTDKPNLRLLKGGASSSPGADSDEDEDDTARTCISLADELIREISELSDHLSPGDAETATTIARVIAEELSEALDNLQERPQVLSIHYITSVGIARAKFDQVLVDLQVAREHGVNPPSLRALTSKATQLLSFLVAIERAGKPDQPPSP